MKYELPWPPSVNKYWTRSTSWKGKPGMMLTPKARAYHLKVLERLGIGRQPLTGRISLTIELYPPDKRRRDIDNVLKALFDTMQKARLYKDDSQVDRLYVKRCEPVKEGMVTVEIREIV